MPSSRKFVDGDNVVLIFSRTGCAEMRQWSNKLNPDYYVLLSDFSITLSYNTRNRELWLLIADRVFGLSRFDSKLALESVKKGTAPGLYVKEGDTTTPWEIYSQVLKSRINTFHPPRWPTLPEWDPPPRSVETESERRHRLLEKERLAVAEEREMRKYAREQYESHHAAWSDLPYIGDE